VQIMVPRALANRAPYVDVVSAMSEQPQSRAISFKVVTDAPEKATSGELDPYAGIEV